MRLGPMLIALVGALITVGLLGSSMYLQIEDEAFTSTAAHAEARVVGPADVSWRDHEGNVELHKFDLYEFATATGQMQRLKSPVTLSQPRREVGARASVLYAPADPTNARLDDGSRTKVARWMAWSSPVGLLFRVFFLAVWRRTRAATVGS